MTRRPSPPGATGTCPSPTAPASCCAPSKSCWAAPPGLEAPVTDLRGQALVVEDDASSRGIFERRLRALGMEVVTAGDGEEGLALARREAPAIILADIKMPRMDGLEMLKALRREGIETTVIVITAFGTIESAVEAMKAGAYDFITKPFDPKHLELVEI